MFTVGPNLKTKTLFQPRPKLNNISLFAELFKCFRRFSASFSQLRLDHRRVKNARKPDLVEGWENEIFTWPVKDVPTELEVLVHLEEEDEGSEPENEAEVTMSGRATGKFSLCDRI